MTSPTHRPDSNLLDPRLQRLRGLLAALERRFRLQDAARLIPWAFGVALVLTIGLALSMRLAGWPDLLGLGIAGAVILLSSIICVVGYAFFRPNDTLATAVKADLRLGLDERLSTAVEDASKHPSSPSASLVALRDAFQRVAVAGNGNRLEWPRQRSRCVADRQTDTSRAEVDT